MSTRATDVLLVLGLVVIAGTARRGQPSLASLQPTALRVEHLENPLAVDAPHPRLTWTFREPVVRGARQTAYQVLVASTAARLAASRGSLWDSGKVASGDSVLISYAGVPLRSGQRCHWKVRVWDEHDRASDWSPPGEWSMGLLQAGDWSARWIGDARPSVEDLSTTMLRKAFTLGQRPVRAVAYVTALGLYEATINGQRVGDHQLAPEWTDYHTRVQYQAYDVTSLLRKGANAIGVILGDGWYAGRIGLGEILLKKPRGHYGTHPLLLAQLEIELPGGRTTRIVTDGSWKVTRDGPIRSADMLDGETYDARREMPGWDAPGFDDSRWAAATGTDAHADGAPPPRLVAQPNQPIRITETLTPRSVAEPQPGLYVFDLGQNSAGWVRLSARGPVGTTIRIRHAEMLNDDGTIYTENLRAARATDTFILAGRGEETFEPRFTYHGFRYVEVTGLAGKPRPGDLVGKVVHSDTPAAGTFDSSDGLLNQLWRNITWTQRSNMHSVPTDCPQRDERLGWMGDILVFAQTGIYAYDLASFLTKWLTDVRDAQADDGRFPDFAPHPFGKNERFAGAPGWGDAGVVVPWRVYENYGDLRVLADSYEAAKRWISVIETHNPDLLWRQRRGNDYGDWLNGDTLVQQGWPSTGGEMPKEMFATAVFAHSADLLARWARALGRADEADRYDRLANQIKAAFNREYVTPAGRLDGNTQAGYALALHFDLLPAAARPLAFGRMVDAVAAYNGHMSTGFHSSHRMMLELTGNGRNDVAYELALKRTFPSWGYSIDNGATTIWERWDGYVKGRGFQDKGMNSFNHYAIGAVGEWLFRVVLGIGPDADRPGYRHVVIRPRPGGGLTWARGAYRSIRGPIAVEWRARDGVFALEVAVPANTTATVHVPAAGETAVTEGGRPAQEAEGVRFVRMEAGAAVFEVGAGRYRFEAR